MICPVCALWSDRIIDTPARATVKMRMFQPLAPRPLRCLCEKEKLRQSKRRHRSGDNKHF